MAGYKDLSAYLGENLPYQLIFVNDNKYQSFQNAILNNESFPLSDYLTYHIDKILYYIILIFYQINFSFNLKL